MLRFLLSLLIAALAGSLGARLAGRDRPLGCLASIALGFIGSLLGSWLAERLGLPLLWVVGGLPVVWAVVGAALFVAVLNLIGGRRQAP